MEIKTQDTVIDTAGNLSIFLTFFTLAWIVYLFPEVVNNFFPTTIAKWLLVASASSITLFENKDDGAKKLGAGDFGVGLGMVIIFIGFVNSFDSMIYKVVMLSLFGFFGFFGVYRGIFTPFFEAVFHNKKQFAIKDKSSEHNTSNIHSVKIFNIILNILELGAAAATILTFVGISF